MELVFDPFDLTDIDVRHHERPAGKAVPFQIGRHVHPKAHADAPPPPTPTGVDYLRLIEDRHTRALGEALNYAHLTDPAEASAPHDHLPPADDGGLDYDTDLLALADDTERHVLTDATDGPDAELEKELADFAALLTVQDPNSPATPADPAQAPAAATNNTNAQVNR